MNILECDSKQRLEKGVRPEERVYLVFKAQGPK